MNRLLCAATALVLLTGPAWAHSAFERSEPKDGQTLSAAPREVRIWFAEPIKVGLSTFAVHNAAGKQVDRGDLRADEKEPALVHLSLSENLSAGLYKVTWSAVAQDMHVGKSGFSFRIAP
ncbi:hypothetical protein BH20VER3_BH20VER3_06290 [soil metagenome]